MKFTYTLDIELQDLPDEKRQELADQAGFGVELLGTVDDIDSWELGRMISAWLWNTDDEFWAGSEMYAAIQRVTVTELEMA